MSNNSKSSAKAIALVVVIIISYSVGSRMSEPPLWLTLLVGAVIAAVGVGIAIKAAHHSKKP